MVKTNGKKRNKNIGELKSIDWGSDFPRQSLLLRLLYIQHAQKYPKLWGKVWEQAPTQAEDQFNLHREENSIRWQRIEKTILQKFGSFKNLLVIEIGAGAGTNAALFAKRGAMVTILDYSEGALARSREFFGRLGLKANFVNCDALKLPKKLLSQFDVAMSFGLTEHFLGDKRVQINKVHFDLLKAGGLAIISVPNKWNLPYQISKFFAQKLGYWKVGEEYPYDRTEMAEICNKLQVRNYWFFGDSLITSLQMINPMWIARKMMRIKKKPDISQNKRERGTFLDQYLSYALVLCANKA